MMDNAERSPTYQQQQKQTENEVGTVFLFSIFKSKIHAAKVQENFLSLPNQLIRKGFADPFVIESRHILRESPK